MSNFILIATDYHAGIGEQAALVYANNLQIKINAKYDEHYSGCEVTDINSALRYIGLVKTRGMDEFDSINLSNYRSFDKYFKNYHNAE